jgi:hypothetical protein
VCEDNAGSVDICGVVDPFPLEDMIGGVAHENEDLAGNLCQPVVYECTRIVGRVIDTVPYFEVA